MQRFRGLAAREEDEAPFRVSPSLWIFGKSSKERSYTARMLNVPKTNGLHGDDSLRRRARLIKER